jgi:phospholipid transport system substrate-binding protein
MIARRFLFAGFALSILLAVGTTAAAQLEDGANKFIRSLAGQAIGSLTDRSAPREIRIERFRELFNDRFAVHAIGKFVLGRHWRRATESEKKEYLGLFEDLMVVSYVDRFARYAGEALEIIKTRADNETTATVFSRIARPGS